MKYFVKTIGYWIHWLVLWRYFSTLNKKNRKCYTWLGIPDKRRKDERSDVAVNRQISSWCDLSLSSGLTETVEYFINIKLKLLRYYFIPHILCHFQYCYTRWFRSNFSLAIEVTETVEYFINTKLKLIYTAIQIELEKKLLNYILSKSN